MKRFLLAAIAAMSVYSGFAQRTMHGHTAHVAGIYGKSTAAGDTSVLTNIPATDTLRTLYAHTGAGSGYVTGNNSYNDMGFAERYTFNGSDSSLRVIGVLAQFGGTVTAGSSRTVTLKAWGTTAPAMVSAVLYYNGYPGIVLDSAVVPVSQLGIGATVDTLKQHLFTAPTAALSGDFFVGYTMAYNYGTLAGDTIALATSLHGQRSTNDYTARYAPVDGDSTAIDTIITLNVQNATQWSDGLWYDNYTQNDSIANNLAIYPIVVSGSPTGAASITRNELTFYGCYPNPAAGAVNIRYAVAEATAVTITVMDMAGRTIATVKDLNTGKGKHTNAISTAAIPAGEYLYTIRTAAGDGMAGKFSVIR